MKNPKTQFTFKGKPELILEAYNWCISNLPLKDDRGIYYNVNELFITTSSQKIVDKVNKHFGSNFSFEDWESLYFYLY